MSKLNNNLKSIYKFSGYVAAFFLILVAVFILIGIASRIFGFYIRGLAEYSGYCMAASSFLALAYTFGEKGHIRITLFLEKSKKNISKIKKIKSKCKFIRNINSEVSDVDLVILCTPMSQYEKIIEKLNKMLGVNCLITDVGSTKQNIIKLKNKILNKKLRIKIITNRTDPDKRDYLVSSKKLYDKGYFPYRSLQYGINQMLKFYDLLSESDNFCICSFIRKIF